MAAENANNTTTYTFTGEDNEIIPQHITHFVAHPSLTTIPAFLFHEHPNIIEVICHEGVKRVEEFALNNCPNLERVIIPGVEVIALHGITNSSSLKYVECPLLEIVESQAFCGCESLARIDLSSVKRIERIAFLTCYPITEAKFGSHLESLQFWAFGHCTSLERIIIPLKDGLFAGEVFTACDKLIHVDVVKDDPVFATIAALQLDEWKNDMHDEIDSIHQILPLTPAGDSFTNVGEKTRAIRDWIRSVLGKIIHYRAEHEELLVEAASILQLVLPRDIVLNNVVPFLELPLYEFELGEEDDEEEESGDDGSSNDGGESYDSSEVVLDSEDEYDGEGAWGDDSSNVDDP